MIASGGLDFDDIVYNRSSSSEEDRGKLSSRSDISNSSSSSAADHSAMAQKNFPPSYIDSDKLNSNSINQKKMVMSEIRRKVFSSDSERENEIFDTIDGYNLYGKTPPRETRRNKSKYKCVKFSGSGGSYSSSRKKTVKASTYNNQNNSFVWQKQRDIERKEKQQAECQINEQEQLTPRSTKLVRVNSSKSLKSISQQRTISSFSKPDELQLQTQGSCKFMSYAVKLATKNTDIKKPSSRQHFHKSFCLLVNLGGKFPSQNYRSIDVNEEETDNFQVEYHEFLWLQLQAYHSSRSVEDQDNYLEEARREVDSVLDKVINYRFNFKKGSYSDMKLLLEGENAVDVNEVDTFVQPSSDSEDEYLTFKTEFDDDDNSVDVALASTPMSEVKRVPTTLITDTNDETVKAETVKGFGTDKNTEESTSKEVKAAGIDQTGEKIYDLAKLKETKVAAMHEIVALLQKVESIELLYPSTKALTAAHPKYKDIKFTRNMEALLLWININKDLYHRLNNLADWIDIDPDDLISWKDWFDCGLDVHCIKTRKSYRTSHHIATGDDLEGSINLPTLLNNIALRKSKRDKRKRISQNRLSFIEKTTTSRYRLFVERSIKENGLIQIMKRTRDFLELPMLKARYCLTDPGDIDSSLRMKRQERRSDRTDMATFLKVFVNLNDQKLIKYLSETEQKKEEYERYAHFSKIFSDMKLPSFVDIYSFLLMVPFDIVHECIRFRLDYKSKFQPSQHSIRQLILECKEVVSGGLICLYHYKQMASIVPQEKKDLMTSRREEFDDDLKSILNIYLDYVQSWFKMSHQSKLTSDSLKNFMEEEWNFAKEICPYIRGAEARAGYKYCCLSSNLLNLTKEFLETSVEECSAKYNPANEENIQRHKMLTACREYKEIFKEVKGRASRALGFAKMLQKDLGIANKYNMNCTMDALFKTLRDTKHYKIDYHGVDIGFWIFVSQECSKKQNFATKLLNLTFGMNGSENSNYYGDGYVLLVPKRKKEKCLWIGRRIALEYTNEVSLAISYIDKVNHVTVICNNLYHLNTQCKTFEHRMNNIMVTLAVERTSSHNVIENSLNELKESTNKLANLVINSVGNVYQNLFMNESAELDEADRNSTHKSCIETMHTCFGVGFEYLRELMRMYHGGNNTGVVDYFVKFSRMWMQFVISKIDEGRGTKPRWAVPGLEFLVATIDPNTTVGMAEEEFSSLQKEMKDCVRHVIGRAQTRTQRKLKAEKRSSSPFTVNRSRSVPSQKKDGSFDSLLTPDQAKPSSNSLPADFNNGMHGISLQDVSIGSNLSSEGDTLDSIPSDTTIETEEPDPPLIRIRNAVKEIDERRTAKLQHMRVIGSVTYKKENMASELVHNVRRVNFKWQLGNKIGEGQFGKVYSAVNLDTGDLMAVKQVRFNPHDYGTIQEIADEITNIQGIQHDTLVKYFGVELHKDEMMIFMEYCADGTIAEVAKQGLSESLIRVYTYQITRAINILHQSGVIHRDIKGANIFLSSSGLIKIGDFGSAVRLKDAMATTQGEVFNTRGTAAFMAPEVITLDKGRGYGRAADIWSLGCVVIEMATGKQPWYECDNIYAIMYRVGNGNHPPIPDRLSEEGNDFLECCFIHDQNYRWTAHMLEGHAFVKI